MTKKDFQKISNFIWQLSPDFRPGMRVPARIYASEKLLEDILEDKSIDQLINGACLPGIVRSALAMPDCHQGYAVPIGFVGAVRTSEGVISPGACGFDINCGMRLLKSGLKTEDIKPRLEKLTDEIYRQVPSGLGKGRSKKFSLNEINNILKQGAQHLVKKGYGTKQDIENCESKGKLDWAEPRAVSVRAKQRGRDQVGSLGSGNHFLEVQEVAQIFDQKTAQEFGLFQDQVVVMIHCGSRGLGHQVCSDYLKKFIPLMEKKYKIKVKDKEFACVPFGSSEGQKYFKAMAGAANYAWANRQMIAYFVRRVWAKILGQDEAGLEALYDVAHNIIKKEKYKIDGREIELAVHRKGATRAFPNQPVLLPGTMGTASYVLVGARGAEETFYSVSHGAGRVMSRRAAKRKIGGRQVVEQLKQRGILIKCRSLGGIAEEAPLAYKNVNKVVEVVHKAGLSKKVAKLVPLAVIKGE